MFLDLSTEDGVIHADIDRNGFLSDIMEHYEAGSQKRRDINIDGKNYILKIENEVRAKYANWKGHEHNDKHGHGHGHGHH